MTFLTTEASIRDLAISTEHRVYGMIRFIEGDLQQTSIANL